MLAIAFRFLFWLFAVLGVATVAVAAMLAAPLHHPPTLVSINESAKRFDHSGLPGLDRYQARDGTWLAYRHYPAATPGSGRVAVLVHGSSASSAEMHMLAKVLAAKGIAAYALDIRGHGASGTHGDITYTGQLEDDLEDFVHALPAADAKAPIVLIGHSSGGAFALRIAGSPIQNLFAKTILLAPYLGYDALTSRPDAGGWASPDLPRIYAVMLLDKVGLPCCQGLPVLAFAVPPKSQNILTAVYSYRLMTNYATHRPYRNDLTAATHPISLFAGAADELMRPEFYAAAMEGKAKVALIPGINHMTIVSDPAATSAIADEALAERNL